MNPCFPDWNTGAEIPVPTLKNKSLGLDRELVELLWENGQVVLHSQTHHHHHRPKPWLPQQQIDSRLINKHNQDQSITRGSVGEGSCENPPTGLIQDTETVSWIDCHVDDPFEKDFSSNFFSEFPLSNPVEGLNEPDKCITKFEDYKSSKICASSEVNHRVSLPNNTNSANFSSNLSFPPPFHAFDSAQQRDTHLGGGISKIADIPLSPKADFRPLNKGGSNRSAGGRDIKEYSVKTVGSSHCGSNQVVNDHADTSRVSSCGIGDGGLSADVAKDHVGKLSSQSDRLQTETMETAITSSSSGGSGFSFGRTCYQSTGTNSHKRKSRGIAEDSECQSKDDELESAAKKKQSLKSGSSRKSRAAEVHNLSERRRRDRINEKMRALQELLPRSNKTDKASMLDEAIEYMKSLQLQLQIMWMGSGMAPMIFPGVQHYLSRLGMGIGPLPIPSVHNPMHFPRLPLVDQATLPNRAALFRTTMLNPINYHNQLANSKFAEQYANYTAFHPLQNASQHMNIFSFGANTAQHNHMPPPSSNCNGTSSG